MQLLGPGLSRSINPVVGAVAVAPVRGPRAFMTMMNQAEMEPISQEQRRALLAALPAEGEHGWHVLTDVEAAALATIRVRAQRGAPITDDEHARLEAIWRRI